MTNEEKQAAIEWLKGRPITMPGAKKMYALAIQALEMYVPDMNVGDMISRQSAIDALDCINGVEEVLRSLPSARPEADRIYSIMKDYYFEHKDEHDQSWQGGFAECMNLIPNVWERR